MLPPMFVAGVGPVDSGLMLTGWPTLFPEPLLVQSITSSPRPTVPVFHPMMTARRLAPPPTVKRGSVRMFTATGVPVVLSVTENLTPGNCPGAVLSTPTTLYWNTAAAARPGMAWLSVTPASPPLAGWQTAQFALVACAPPVWSLFPVGAGVTKLMSSWHDPHAAIEGRVIQRSPSGVAASADVWHFTQLRTSWG